MNRDPGVRKYFPGLLTPEESLGGMTRIEQHWDTHGFGPWALEGRADFAGMLGLKWVAPNMPFAPAVELLHRSFLVFGVKDWTPKARLQRWSLVFASSTLTPWSHSLWRRTLVRGESWKRPEWSTGGDFDHPSIPELSPLRWHVLYSLKRDNWHEKYSPFGSRLLQQRA
jgi:hypothetical protein